MTASIDRMTFEAELRAPGGPGLVRANLLFAREIAYPELKPSRCLAVLDAWAEQAPSRCGVGSMGERAAGLAAYLFDALGLRGNADDYYDPRNSYLNVVIEARLGLPIALSALYIEMAHRLGLPAHGIGLPGHFVVGVGDGEARVLLDPFNGGMALTLADAGALVRGVTGLGGPLHPDWLKPVTTPDILVRMLLNLRGVYVRREAWPQAVLTVERLRMLQPGDPDHLRDLGLLCQRAGSLRAAVAHLEDYLLLAGDRPAAEPIRQHLNALIRELSRLN